ncbi:hypothetical protein [Streptomyces sp. NPDC006551]|uniref:hypothetical protein n=1 Tax=Streptomyces sp. NPDC006551 TaxID=3157178 RepID=UPI0033B1E72D
MTTTAESTPAPTPASQGTHHWVMTLEHPKYGSASANGTWTPPAGYTRHDAFMTIRRDLTSRNPQLESANVVFFSIERNTL